MASSPEDIVPELYQCYHCGVESADSLFKYFDNKKTDQPRHQCHNCRKFFTLGEHGRPHGRTYAKKRNVDPDELKSLSRQCRHCGVTDNAVFKYYNNKSPSQPRFKCLSCGKQFQMRLLGTGEERHLVHTSSQQRPGPRRRKQGSSTSSNCEGGGYQPFLPVPSDSVMSLESGTRLLPDMGDEEVEYANFLDAELTESEEACEAKFTSSTDMSDDVELPPLSAEDAQLFDLLLDGSEMLAEPESYEALNDHAFSPSANVATYALPPSWGNEDAEFMSLMEAGARDNEAQLDVQVPVSVDVQLDVQMPVSDDVTEMVADDVTEMVPESTTENLEVMYGTLVPDSPAAACSEPRECTENDDATMDSLDEMNYAEAAAACCRQMDLDMAAQKNAMQTAPWTFYDGMQKLTENFC